MTTPTISGVRPLRLASSAESPIITSPLPVSPLTPISGKRSSGSARNPRRQSSISYNLSPREDASFSPRHASPIIIPASRPSLNRSASIGSRTSKSQSVDFGGNKSPAATSSTNRNSTGSLLNIEEKERPPLTLVEKHAELLQFIAQKESKCLELRTQLAAHESELLQLKKKWERIVFRGFEKSQAAQPDLINSESSISLSSTHPPSASIYSANSLSYLDSLSAQAQGAGGAAMLEALGLGGMRDIRASVQQGVQGVGRFLGAVAGTSEPSSPRISTHALSESLSSSSASTTSSTRFSQSSQSSVAASISEEDVSPPIMKKSVRKNRPAHIGIISDTGATPLISPTRDFAFGTSPPRTATPLSPDQSMNGRSIRVRRKSRAFESESPAEETSPYADSDTSTSHTSHTSSESLSTSLVDWGMGLSSPPPASPLDSSNLAMGLDADRKRRDLNKRMSLPVSSGLGAGPSWMGSMVGKRWEDTISKNHKRASVLLSDVSQSISQSLPQSIQQPMNAIHALVSPPLNATSEFDSGSSGLLTPPGRGLDPGRSRSRTPSSMSSTSLLDEDIPLEEGGLGTPSLLSPTVLSPTKLASTLIPTKLASEPKPKSPMKKKAVGSAKVAKEEDDDDNWNW
ncbi:hypothetical protein BDP27DRAFT_427182 [Rhodocollybia butyracea]|uniref:DUF4048 domain-containing protein n=1 Tax=Rhodocollybia butyracea TaxID=206335 RepID=A0A9P5PZZ3_9AGAR|nr:hypothetical protein BDP27DRAFT_427182 [Rhodocollybia butyracea]